MRILKLVGLSLVVLLAPPVGAQQFVPGDLYLLSNTLLPTGKGILRINPLTGASTLLTSYSISAQSTFTYDPNRDRLIYTDGRTTGGLVAVDAAGNRVDMAPALATPHLVAARGDGILYLLTVAVPYTLRYLDGAGVAHDVLDAAGAAPFQLTSGNFFDEMIYDPVTNSVFLLTGTLGGLPPPCTTSGRTCAVKIPLTMSGTQVAGPMQFTDVDVSPAVEIVVGSGLVPYAPSGRILIVVDTNENMGEPRMQLLNPVTMTTSVFATNGENYPAAAGAAGTYSTPRSQAVLLDYGSSCLRGFSEGGSGSGNRFAENVSGFLSRLIEIRPAGLSGAGGINPPQSHLRLDPVTPNPVSDMARVRFTLPASGPVRVTILDAAGRLVRLLAEVTGEAGPNTLLWDGRDDRGRLVPEGPYFVRLRANGETIVRKMIVLRS